MILTRSGIEQESVFDADPNTGLFRRFLVRDNQMLTWTVEYGLSLDILKLGHQGMRRLP